MERAAKVSGSRFVYLKGDLVMLQLALVRYGLDVIQGKGFRPVIPPVLVREEAMYGTGFFPTDRAQVYETVDGDCLVGHQRGAAGGHAHGGVPRGGGAAAALRRLLELLPPRGRRRRARHPRHPARAPVRQGRDVQLLPAGAGRRRAPAHPLRRGGDPAGSRHPVPRGEHRRRRPRRPGGAEVRLRGVDARARRSTARSRAAPTAPTTRRGASTAATGRRRGRASCTP